MTTYNNKTYFEKGEIIEINDLVNEKVLRMIHQDKLIHLFTEGKWPYGSYNAYFDEDTCEVYSNFYGEYQLVGIFKNESIDFIKKKTRQICDSY